MLSSKFKSIIKFIHSKLKDKEIKWAFIGSTNLALQGMEISPNDVDIITNPDDLKVFKAIFKNYES